MIYTTIERKLIVTKSAVKLTKSIALVFFFSGLFCLIVVILLRTSREISREIDKRIETIAQVDYKEKLGKAICIYYTLYSFLWLTIFFIACALDLFISSTIERKIKNETFNVYFSDAIKILKNYTNGDFEQKSLSIKNHPVNQMKIWKTKIQFLSTILSIAFFILFHDEILSLLEYVTKNILILLLDQSVKKHFTVCRIYRFDLLNKVFFLSIKISILFFLYYIFLENFKKHKEDLFFFIKNGSKISKDPYLLWRKFKKENDYIKVIPFLVFILFSMPFCVLISLNFNQIIEYFSVIGNFYVYESGEDSNEFIRKSVYTWLFNPVYSKGKIGTFQLGNIKPINTLIRFFNFAMKDKTELNKENVKNSFPNIMLYKKELIMNYQNTLFFRQKLLPKLCDVIEVKTAALSHNAAFVEMLSDDLKLTHSLDERDYLIILREILNRKTSLSSLKNLIFEDEEGKGNEMYYFANNIKSTRYENTLKEFIKYHPVETMRTIIEYKNIRNKEHLAMAVQVDKDLSNLLAYVVDIYSEELKENIEKLSTKENYKNLKNLKSISEMASTFFNCVLKEEIEMRKSWTEPAIKNLKTNLSIRHRNLNTDETNKISDDIAFDIKEINSVVHPNQHFDQNSLDKVLEGDLDIFKKKEGFGPFSIVPQAIKKTMPFFKLLEGETYRFNLCVSREIQRSIYYDNALDLRAIGFQNYDIIDSQKTSLLFFFINFILSEFLAKIIYSYFFPQIIDSFFDMVFCDACEKSISICWPKTKLNDLVNHGGILTAMDFNLHHYTVNNNFFIFNRCVAEIDQDINIIGTHGSGKSILAYLLKGRLDYPPKGITYHFEANGHKKAYVGNSRHLSDQIFYVPQNFYFSPKAKICNVLDCFSGNMDKKRKDIFLKDFENFKKIFNLINVNNENSVISNDAEFYKLSHGEKKRILIAILLAYSIDKASFIIIDGLENLDEENKRIIMQTILSTEFKNTHSKRKINVIFLNNEYEKYSNLKTFIIKDKNLIQVSEDPIEDFVQTEQDVESLSIQNI